MKKCCYCAEEIQDEALKCKHCGEFLGGGNSTHLLRVKEPWYFRPVFIVVAFCTVGPLALPLIWWRPRTSPTWKIIWTVVVLVLSWISYQVAVDSLQVLSDYYQLLDNL